MMGTVIRRNWRFDNISNPDASEGTYTLVGPLCTSIDVLATGVVLPDVRVGDVLAIHNSGAYGHTASPARFISHPEPSEVLMTADGLVDGTEHSTGRTLAVPVRTICADKAPTTGLLVNI
jgi:diaminopimelate decarboxylase